MFFERGFYQDLGIEELGSMRFAETAADKRPYQSTQWPAISSEAG